MPDCTKCGRCCSKPVAVLYEEAKKISELPIEIDFALLKQKVNARNFYPSCIFLENNLCSIYKHRPEMCRQYICGKAFRHEKQLQEKFEKYGKTTLHLSLYRIIESRKKNVK